MPGVPENVYQEAGESPTHLVTHYGRTIAMDIVGPLPRSSSGKRYILVICDYARRLFLRVDHFSTAVSKSNSCSGGPSIETQRLSPSEPPTRRPSQMS
jgi:hypothetical protein